MSEYRFDAVIDERAQVFAMWLAHEAEGNPTLVGYQKVFMKVGEDIAAPRLVDNDEVQLLYGVISGHARAWGYVDDFEQDPKLYLSHYIARVGEDVDTP